MISTARMRLLSTTATACLATASLAACGGGSGDGGPSTDAFLKQTTAICKEHGDAINKVASNFKERPAGAELKKFVDDTVVPEYSDQIDEIGKLDPPSDLSADVATWLTTSGTVRDHLGDDPKALLTPKTFTDVNLDAIGLGLGPDCTPGNRD